MRRLFLLMLPRVPLDARSSSRIDSNGLLTESLCRRAAGVMRRCEAVLNRCNAPTGKKSPTVSSRRAVGLLWLALLVVLLVLKWLRGGMRG